ncbi:MAG: acyltransferase family protein [Roseobacter sp.]|jgi:peptidoglycan/LPS O-acetylase OafA/YrhL|nr:acyltransferase family protein [Roseobacter sp.]
MLPEAFADLGASAIATSLFGANFYFWQTASDYFSGQAEYAPLLHTWSLGVEEQFYIIAPLVLYASIRWKGRSGAFWTILALSLASLAISIAYSREYASEAFYLPLTRTYELGIGALLALAPVVQMPRRALREIFAAAGLTMIAYAVMFFDASTVFPGSAALVPCIGAGLVIFAAKSDTLVGRALSLGPMVFVGLLSYSLYLWHWPILVLARHYTASLHLPPLVVSGCIGVAFVMSIFSLRYVETPFRHRSLAASKRSMFTASGAALTATIAAGAVVFSSEGVPTRLSPEARHIVGTATNLNRPASIDCTQQSGITFCRNTLVASGKSAEVLFVGDSHVRASAPFALDALAKQGVAARAIWREGCPPIPDIYRTSRGSTDRNCPDLAQKLLSELDANPEIRIVIVHARWSLYGSGERIGQEPGGPVFLTPAGSDLNLDLQHNATILQKQLSALFGELSERGQTVIVIGSVPEIGWSVPEVLISNIRFGMSLPDRPNAAFFGPDKRGKFDAEIARMARDRPNVYYASAFETFCSPVCEIWDGATPYYSDTNHLSWRGAEILSELVVDEVLNALR